MSPDSPLRDEQSFRDAPAPRSRAQRAFWIYAITASVLIVLVLCAGLVAVVVVPRLGAARLTAMQVRSEGQLRSIALALESYHAKYQQFPAAYTVDAQGRPLLSWRVALLPHLGELELHSEFDLAKAWDSPENRPLVQRMPAVYLLAFQPPGTPLGETSVATIRELSSVFPGQQAMGLEDCTGDPRQTIAVVAAAQQTVAWTAPEDLSAEQLYALLPKRSQRLPQPVAVMLGGEVRRLDQSVGRETIGQWISRSGSLKPPAEPLSPEESP